MVVCKCRKATKLYCFVHRTPLCLDCICTSEHENCVVAQYSDWVNDGDYDWPPLCPLCKESTLDQASTRLGCLHVCHSSCLQQHLESFPAHTAPAGYTCPAPGCQSAIWPPKTQKLASSTLYTKLRSFISGTSVSDSILMAPIPAASLATTPGVSREQSTNDLALYNNNATSTSLPLSLPPPQTQQQQQQHQEDEIVPINGQDPSSKADLTPPPPHQQQLAHKQSPPQTGTARSRAVPHGSPGLVAVAVDIEEDLSKGAGAGYASDFESGEGKYARRGPPHVQFLRALGLGFLWGPHSNKGLPVTLSKKERESEVAGDDASEGRLGRRSRSTKTGGGTLDPRRLLLGLAILSCMATMGLLYYRLAQGTFTEAQLP